MILVTGATVTLTILGLAGIALGAVASLLAQAASATTNALTETVGGVQVASDITSMNTTINNNTDSNAVLETVLNWRR